MHLNCPDCETTIVADDVHLVKTIAKCRECNNIFDFTRQLSEAGELMPWGREIVMPPGIEVLKLMSELEIMINWRKSGSYFTFFFALVWNLIVSIISIVVFAQGATAAMLFMIPFIAAGVYLVYASMGYLFNTSYITVDEHRLSIEHKPVSFLIQKDQHFHPSEIEQLYVKQYEVGKKNETPVHAYSLEMELKKGKTITLVKNLHAEEYGKYLEQEMETFMKIKDRPMAGEWNR